jgi:hypothetical protein
VKCYQLVSARRPGQRQHARIEHEHRVAVGSLTPNTAPPSRQTRQTRTGTHVLYSVVGAARGQVLPAGGDAAAADGLLMVRIRDLPGEALSDGLAPSRMPGAPPTARCTGRWRARCLARLTHLLSAPGALRRERERDRQDEHTFTVRFFSILSVIRPDCTAHQLPSPLTPSQRGHAQTPPSSALVIDGAPCTNSARSSCAAAAATAAAAAATPPPVSVTGVAGGSG